MSVIESSHQEYNQPDKGVQSGPDCLVLSKSECVDLHPDFSSVKHVSEYGPCEILQQLTSSVASLSCLPPALPRRQMLPPGFRDRTCDSNQTNCLLHHMLRFPVSATLYINILSLMIALKKKLFLYCLSLRARMGDMQMK